MKLNQSPNQTPGMSVVDYLNKVVSMTTNTQGPYAILTKHGRGWASKLKPADVPWGLKKMCFMNALTLTLSNPGFTYVEGYASHYVPIHHAWVLDQDGNVIDNTWRELGSEYFGIPFERDYVAEAACTSGLYSVLFNPRFPNIDEDSPEKYLSKRFAINCTGVPA